MLFARGPKTLGRLVLHLEESFSREPSVSYDPLSDVPTLFRLESRFRYPDVLSVRGPVGEERGEQHGVCGKVPENVLIFSTQMKVESCLSRNAYLRPRSIRKNATSRIASALDDDAHMATLHDLGRLMKEVGVSAIVFIDDAGFLAYPDSVYQDLIILQQ